MPQKKMPNDEAVAAGVTLRAIRKRLGMTQLQFALALGYTGMPAISYAETGERGRTALRLIKKACAKFNFDQSKKLEPARGPDWQKKTRPSGHYSGVYSQEAVELGARLKALRGEMKLEEVKKITRNPVASISRAERGWMTPWFIDILIKKLEKFLDSKAKSV